MSPQPQVRSADSVPTGSAPAVRAQTLRFQGTANAVVRSLLHAPIVGRLMGRRLMLIEVVGRKSGRRFSVPVAYTRQGPALMIASAFPWIRNLRTGDPVPVLLAGRTRTAEVRVLTAEGEVTEHLSSMARDNHQFAKFNRIGFDSTGNPLAEDLRAAWTSGTRVVLLTPRRGRGGTRVPLWISGPPDPRRPRSSAHMLSR